MHFIGLDGHYIGAVSLADDRVTRLGKVDTSEVLFAPFFLLMFIEDVPEYIAYRVESPALRRPMRLYALVGVDRDLAPILERNTEVHGSRRAKAAG